MANVKIPENKVEELKELCKHDLLAKDSGSANYVPGPALKVIARQVIGSGEKGTVLRSHLARLSAATGNSALYVETDGPALSMRMRRVLCHNIDGGVNLSAGDEPCFVLAQGFGVALMAQYDDKVNADILAVHVARTGENEQALWCELHRLRSDNVLVRCEKIGSSPLGATRIVAPVCVPGAQPAAVGITAFGTVANGLEQSLVDLWALRVKQVSHELEKDLQVL